MFGPSSIFGSLQSAGATADWQTTKGMRFILTFIYIYIQLYINHQQSLLSWPWEPSENAGSSSIVVMACLNFLTLQKSDCLHVAWALSKCGNSEPSKEI